ncbi:hypothetical protein HRM2_13500 [Desulforapulum autotrophicum HRM2]|uniref:Host attachment protein n=1 Tax=Desulforapulum autotrophicum (strain ATCC 43914 / DSM 3382 / VKM B-1955 / HRM2) TaxID=177437 RepID=C0Q8X1_DESAH|nr:hypothetical protein [Desulforapulum autotrophicum]ACN14461.1 hypothetical protein HRM2_13500 [Desulforapulum autotrophicum HRM2]
MIKSEQKKKMGIWLDHRDAFLILIKDDQTTVEHIKSNADSHFRPKGGWKASGTAMAQSVSKEKTADERRKHELHDFYHTLIQKFAKMDTLLIFGPGEAKHELTKEIEKIKVPHPRIAAVKSAEKLTENQLVAEVKSFFSVPEDRQLP